MITDAQINAANEQEIDRLNDKIKALQGELAESERLHGLYREALAERNRRAEQAREMLAPSE